MEQITIPPVQTDEPNIKVETVTLLQDSAFITKAAECVRLAQKRILICAYTWRWYENSPEKDIQKFNYEIARRSLNGLDIRAILNMKTQAEYLKQYGINTRTLPTDRTLHTKAILVDDSTLIIGSHNLTERGTADNFELSTLVNDASVALLFADYFEKMWQNYAV